VKDKEERHPEGAYYLDWRRNGVRVRLSVGENAQDALTQRDRKTFELNAANHGVVVQNEVQNGDGTNGDGRKPLSVSEGMREDPGGTAYARLHPRLVFFLRPRRPQPCTLLTPQKPRGLARFHRAECRPNRRSWMRPMRRRAFFNFGPAVRERWQRME
jgi:hypothetical protein